MIDFGRIIQSLEKEPVEDEQFAQLLDFIIQKLFPGGEYRLRYDPLWFQYTLDIHHEGKKYQCRSTGEQLDLIRALKSMIEHYNIKQLGQ